MPHIRVPSGEAQHPLPFRADPDRWVRSLHRLWLGDRAIELVEAALVGRSRLGREEPHCAERLAEHRDTTARTRTRKTKLSEFGLGTARTDPGLASPLRQAIG